MADKLSELFSDILSVDVDTLNDNTSPKNTEAWDSLANMILLSAIEETFEVELSSDEIVGMTSLGLVRKTLAKRGVALS